MAVTCEECSFSFLPVVSRYVKLFEETRTLYLIDWNIYNKNHGIWNSQEMSLKLLSLFFTCDQPLLKKCQIMAITSYIKFCNLTGSIARFWHSHFMYLMRKKTQFLWEIFTWKISSSNNMDNSFWRNENHIYKD